MNNRKHRWYPAHAAGIISLIAAVAAFLLSPCLSAAILLLYVVLCVGACFFPQTGFLGPVISRGRTGRPLVALTFDDGPSEPTTGQVLDLLDQYQMKATFFVSGINAQKYPGIIADIVARGHDVGNHSLSHNPLLMLKSERVLFREISEARRVLNDLGIETKAFRPPVGIINPKLFNALISLDMFCVNFSCRAGDAGNRRIRHLSARILSKVKADDIILLHDVPARNDADCKYLLSEIERILAGIGHKGLQVVPLGELIGREIMQMRGEVFPDFKGN